MPTATLDDIEVHALLPRALDGPPAERFRQALGTPLTQAVPDAFETLDDLDPGAYWVIREVHARVQVRASEPDPGRAAAAIARAMAAAVTDVVLRGPSADAVRFADRTAYLAAYVRARLVVGGESWVFSRLAALAALPPLDAVPAAARLLEVELLDAVGALVRAGDWERLLTAADPSSAARVWDVLARLPEPSAALDPVVLTRIAELRRAAPAAVRGRTSAARRLRLLGLGAQTRALTAADVAAVARLEPEDDGPPERDGGATPSGVPGDERPGASADAETPDAVVAPRATRPEPAEPSVLRCAGAVAFLLVADLAEVLESEDAAAWLLEPEPVAGEVRAAALAAVIGRGVDRDDVAVRLAAGVETAPDEEVARAVTIPTFRDPLLAQQHQQDEVWFAPVVERMPDVVPLARALARRFAAHLHGFSGAGPAYLAERVMPLGGSIRLTDDAVLVDLPRPPLHVLLAMAGLDAFSCQVPWLELPVLLTHEEEW